MRQTWLNTTDLWSNWIINSLHLLKPAACFGWKLNDQKINKSEFCATGRQTKTVNKSRAELSPARQTKMDSTVKRSSSQPWAATFHWLLLSTSSSTSSSSSLRCHDTPDISTRKTQQRRKGRLTPLCTSSSSPPYVRLLLAAKKTNWAKIKLLLLLPNDS